MRYLVVFVLLAVVFTACLEQERAPAPEEPPVLPEALMAFAKTAAPADQESVLSALVVLVRARMIREWAWTEPTEGSAVHHYEVQVDQTTLQPSIYVVTASKDSIRVRAAGVDAEGRQGVWSVWSETLIPGD